MAILTASGSVAGGWLIISGQINETRGDTCTNNMVVKAATLIKGLMNIPTARLDAAIFGNGNSWK